MKLATQAAALVLFAALASSCTNVTPFIVTGKSLSLLENQFADTGAAMSAGLDAGKVTPERYKQWVEFGKRFKAVDQVAFDAWTAAVAANDSALAGKFGEALGLLAAELLTFYNEMKAANLLPPGAP